MCSTSSAEMVSFGMGVGGIWVLSSVDWTWSIRVLVRLGVAKVLRASSRMVVVQFIIGCGDLELALVGEVDGERPYLAPMSLIAAPSKS